MSKIKDPKQSPRLVRSGTNGSKKYRCNKADECGVKKCPHYARHKLAYYAGCGLRGDCTAPMMCKTINDYTVCMEV